MLDRQRTRHVTTQNEGLMNQLVLDIWTWGERKRGTYDQNEKERDERLQLQAPYVELTNLAVQHTSHRPA